MQQQRQQQQQGSSYTITQRPRRNRSSAPIRALVSDTLLDPSHLVLPLFVTDAHPDARVEIRSMPGCFRMGINQIVATVREASSYGVPAVALFPHISDDARKDSYGTESWNDDGVLQRCVRAIKQHVPHMCVITDVALDPYSCDGHDGFVDRQTGEVVNDETLPLLAKMAVAQARAGADVIAPSDMMDGRVGVIRRALDEAGFSRVLICSYCVKYASAFYGPFREALDSAPRAGDKKTYQMDPGNWREAMREMRQDEEEGADWLMVKPGLPYLDMVRMFRDHTSLPVAVYHVSGEFAMLKAASQLGYIDYDRAIMETLVSFRRAGANMIFTYAAMDAAKLIARQRAEQQRALLTTTLPESAGNDSN